ALVDAVLARLFLGGLGRGGADPLLIDDEHAVLVARDKDEVPRLFLVPAVLQMLDEVAIDFGLHGFLAVEANQGLSGKPVWGPTPPPRAGRGNPVVLAGP